MTAQEIIIERVRSELKAFKADTIRHSPDIVYERAYTIVCMERVEQIIENIIGPFSRTVSLGRLTTIAHIHNLLAQLVNAWKDYDVDEDLGEGLATFIWSTLENYRFAQETYHFV